MRFKSKKNKVILADGIVVKEFRDPKTLFRECQALKRLRLAGLKVPEVLGVEGNTLKLEFIPGPTYKSLVEKITLEQAKALAEWLSKYHAITGTLRGDVNLRNFLWSEGACVGVDFEDPPLRGKREIDLGKIIAFTVTYRPPFTKGKANSASLLLQAFLKKGGRREKIKAEYLREISAMNRRRENANFKLEKAASFFENLKWM